MAIAIGSGVAGGCVAERVSAVDGAPGGADAAAAVDGGREVSIEGATDGAPADAGVISVCSGMDAGCTASAGGCNVGSYYLYDNQWNCGADSGHQCGAESAYGCVEAADGGTVGWVVTSNQAAGNTDVLAYSAMQQNFPNNPSPPLSSFTNITATFAESSPHVGSYDDAFDIWLNGVGMAPATVVVIWVDSYMRTPPGTQMKATTLGPHTYDVYVAPSQVTLVATPPFTSGTVDLLQILGWASLQSFVPPNSTLGQIELGVEIASTDGEAASFEFGDFSIVATQ